MHRYNPCYNGEDYLDEAGANILAAKIRAFWARGLHTVHVYVVKMLAARSAKPDHERHIYVVRSDIGRLLARAA